MALSSKVGSLSLNTSTGNQSVTGLGFTPKAILFFSNSKTSDGNTGNLDYCQGIAVSSSSRAVLAAAETNGAGTTDAESYHSTAACLAAINVAGTPILIADFVSMDADGFTINITTSDGVARVVNYIALGGTDLTNVAIKQWLTATATGNQAVTGVGFQPDAIFTLGSLASVAPPAARASIFHSYGFGVSASQRGMSAIHSGNGLATTVTESSQETNKIVEQNNVTTSQSADLVSMDSDGFTVNWSTANATARYQFALCLKGGRFTVGSFNQPNNTTGAQAITGLGFKPTGILLQSTNLVSGSGLLTGSRLSQGAGSSSSARFNIWQGDAAANVGVKCNQDLDRTKIIKMITEGTPTTNAAADLTSLDTDGFTINWSTCDATQRQILYFAWGDVGSASPSLSPSASPSRSPSSSISLSPSLSPSASVSLSPSSSLSRSPSLSPSLSISLSPSASISLSPSLSDSPSESPSPSAGITKVMSDTGLIGGY